MLKRRTAVECVAVPGMQASQTTSQTMSQTTSQTTSQTSEMTSQTVGGETLQTLMKQGAEDVELKVGGEVGGEG